MFYFHIETIQHDVSLKDVIIAQYERGFHKKTLQNEIELFPTQYFSVHYCRKIKGNRLKHHHVVFQAPESEICKSWVDNIKATLKSKLYHLYISILYSKNLGRELLKREVESLFIGYENFLFVD